VDPGKQSPSAQTFSELNWQIEACNSGMRRAESAPVATVSAGPKLVETAQQLRRDTPVTIVDLAASDNALLDFADAESSRLESRNASPRQAAPRSRAARAVLPIILAVLVLASVGAGAFWIQQRRPVASATSGSLSIQSEPAGAEVAIDGSVHGTTPLTINLSPGSHAVSVTGRDGRREMRVAIVAGQQAVHHITWARAEAAAAAIAPTGGLSVTTDARGEVVLLDGTERGRTPLRLDGIAAGPHVVTVRSGGGTHRRTIDVAPGVTTSLVISTAAGASGWLTVSTPLPMQVREDGQLVGTTEVKRMMLPPGEHDLEFVADAVGFTTRRAVRITAGQGTTLELPVPRAAVNINAAPWAEVLVDGERIGETPLANVLLPLGAHEIVFRHPELGERRVQAVATLRETVRVSVDMRNR
jgi:hypothetical protein